MFLTEDVFLSQTIGMRAVVFFEKSLDMLKCCKCEERYEKSKIYIKNICQNSHTLVDEIKKKYLLKNTSFLSKILCSHGIFQIWHKTPCRLTHNWSKKRQICQNYAILWAKNPIGCPFSHFSRHFRFHLL